MNTYIFLKEISKDYGKKKNKTTVLKNINLNICKGEFLAIMGPSGSGKTTLLNIISFLHKPTSGEYYFKGVNTSSLNSSAINKLRNKNIGYLFQNHFLFDNYTSLENTLMPTEYNDLKDKNYFLDFSNKLFSKLNLIGKKNKYQEQLSGGEKQRVALSRALITENEILVADEPTSSLDLENSNKIIDYLIELNNEGKTIILATHNRDIATKCSRIIYLEDGEIKWDKSKNLL